jgi:uncharacterized protein YgbK (DUF1537 family)
MRTWGGVLADDATGALECGSLLAAMGVRTLVWLGGVLQQLPPCEVLVVDTETRHGMAGTAAATVAGWQKYFMENGIERIFKKTDSTLRGHIGAELAVLGKVVYAPAYPALGRVVQGGRLYVDGVPVEETAFGRDSRQPVRSGVIRDLFPAEAAVEIVEGEPDFRDVPIAAGPAGWIRTWAGGGGAVSALPAVRRWLVVCGSLHPRSRRQAERARALGMVVVMSPAETFGEDPEAVAERLAALAVDEMAGVEVVMMFGGDTARALWRAMGVELLEPLPEVLPGVAACRAPGKATVFVTKAGGFGEDDLVDQVRERMQ